MRIRKRLFALLLSLACMLSLTACAGQGDASKAGSGSDLEEQQEDITKSLENVIETTGFKGIVLVTRGDETLLLKSNGYADKARTLPLDENTPFCLADNTKQFTAAAVMRLLHQDKIRITDNLSKYFPDCPYADQVNIHQLLCMRSGIPDYLTETDKDGSWSLLSDDRLPVSVSESAGAAKNKETIESYILSRELRFKAGTKAEYSNSNYFLLARIIEIASGKTFEEYVRENVLSPLEMTRTGFVEDMKDQLPESLVTDTGEEYVYWPGVGFGCENMVSTLHDLKLWEESFWNYRLFTKDIITDMIYNNSDKKDAFSYGYGLMPDDEYGEAFFHSGKAASFASMLYVNRADHTGFILLTNRPETDIKVVGSGLVNNLSPGIEIAEESP